MESLWPVRRAKLEATLNNREQFLTCTLTRDFCSNLLVFTKSCLSKGKTLLTLQPFWTVNLDSKHLKMWSHISKVYWDTPTTFRYPASAATQLGWMILGHRAATRLAAPARFGWCSCGCQHVGLVIPTMMLGKGRSYEKDRENFSVDEEKLTFHWNYEITVYIPVLNYRTMIYIHPIVLQKQECRTVHPRPHDDVHGFNTFQWSLAVS